MEDHDFCHLHIHSEYSQLDGLGSPKAFVEKAKELNHKYIALTDHGNIDGLIKFQKACKENEIKPILGVEGYLVNKWDKKEKRGGHICLWVKNRKGFKNLCKMLSIANLEGYYYVPRINYETLLKYHKGLVIGTACALSFLKKRNGEKLFYDLIDLKKDDIYLEIMPHNQDFQIEYNKYILSLSKKTRTKVICTQDAHYINKRDWKAHEVLLAIQRKAKWDDPKRWKFQGKEYYLKSTQEMISSLKKIKFYKPEYLTNTIEIGEKCSNFIIPKLDIKLPHIPNIDPDKEKEILWKLCIEGFEKIFRAPIDKYNVYKPYKKQLKFEYKLITQKNFTRYFLIVWELCNWCRNNNILIGPGRGSVGGSLMAFLLGITSIDPLKHNLIFDRFINAERIDFPDIDLDFEDTKRHLIKQHLESLYGDNNIAGVSSFNRMKAKAAIQDVARVFDVKSSEAVSFSKKIDDKFDDEIGKIQNAINTEPECKDFAEKYPKVIKYATSIENNVRGYGQHAAALVISIKDIGKTGRCVLLERDGTKLINWEKDDTEHVGLMKLDALGLKLLSILNETLVLIKNNHNKTIKLESLELDDKKVLKEISNGNVVGVFQFNTWAMTRLVGDMGIENFQHMADAVALVRPGPYNSGMTEEYILRKHGKTWEKKNDVYEDITKTTYGELVYQEQVMFVINKVAGLSYSTADTIRKIIGKKRDKKEFEIYKKQFIDGCKNKKLFSKKEAIEFWTGLQEWAKYGFNLAHSVGYAILAYWCAWLKYYYPNEFLCSSLTYGSKTKKPELIEEIYRLGLTLKLPKVNISDPEKWIAKDNKLYVPFIEIKGIGKKKALEIANSPIQKNNIRKFYSSSKFTQTITKQKGKLGKLLDSVGAYELDKDIEITDEVEELFDFRLMLNPQQSYPKLFKLFDNNLDFKDLDKALNGDFKLLKSLSKTKRIIRPKIFQGFNNLLKCSKCLLINECKRPVAPSSGMYNIVFVGEAPGPDEDKKGKGFIGKSGKKIWKFVKKRGYKRKQFHITNINKCYPKNSRKPSKEQINICGNEWLHNELLKVKPRIILAFGNTARQFFEGIDIGITSISGKTSWNEKYGCWICWCIHPSATFRSLDNEVYFKAGMNNFFKVLKIFGKNILENFS